jgi:hypothetical protein
MSPVVALTYCSPTPMRFRASSRIHVWKTCFPLTSRESLGASATCGWKWAALRAASRHSAFRVWTGVGHAHGAISRVAPGFNRVFAVRNILD